MRARIPPLAYLAIGTAVSWLLAEFVVWGRYDAWASRTLGTALLAAGACMLIPAIRAFHDARTTVDPRAPERADVLVTSGLYRFTRNPMYLGMAALLTGEALLLQQGLALLVPLAFVAAITAFQIRAEEKALATRFGEAYGEYCARTRRWL